MAMRQSGQWRMAGRRETVIKKHHLKSTVRLLIQIKAAANCPVAACHALVWTNDLDQSANRRIGETCPMWQPASDAPFDSDLELAVIDEDGPHALVFACQRIRGGWINASTKERLDVRPTHWRPWADKH
jgi:hypothetical protein